MKLPVATKYDMQFHTVSTHLDVGGVQLLLRRGINSGQQLPDDPPEVMRHALPDQLSHDLVAPLPLRLPAADDLAPLVPQLALAAQRGGGRPLATLRLMARAGRWWTRHSLHNILQWQHFCN